MDAIIKDKTTNIIIKRLFNVPAKVSNTDKKKVLENVCKTFQVNANNFVLEIV